MGRVYHENPPARFQQGGYGGGQGMQGFAGRGMGMGMGGRCAAVLRPPSPTLVCYLLQDGIHRQPGPTISGAP